MAVTEWPQERAMDIIYRYCEKKEPMTTIALHYYTKPSIIRRLLVENGIHIRSRAEQMMERRKLAK